MHLAICLGNTLLKPKPRYRKSVISLLENQYHYNMVLLVFETLKTSDFQGDKSHFFQNEAQVAIGQFLKKNS